MQIQFLKSKEIDTLKRDHLLQNVHLYRGDNSWLETKYSKDELFATYDKVIFPDFSLKISKGTQDDFENMKTIYTALKDLTLSQASDERIWAGLAHTYCWDYMQMRWPLPKNKSEQPKHILNNYFFNHSTKSLFLNGISRLWWYAEYTYDESFKDPFELTHYICTHDINGKIYPMLACRFVTNPTIFKTIIKAVKEYEETRKIELSRRQFLDLKEYLNRISGKIVIDSLDENEIHTIIFKKLDVIISKSKSKKRRLFAKQ